MALVVKNLPTNAGDIRDVGSVPGLVDPLEEGMTTHSSILARRILWTEEHGGLQSMRSQRVRHGGATNTIQVNFYSIILEIGDLMKCEWEIWLCVCVCVCVFIA